MSIEWLSRIKEWYGRASQKQKVKVILLLVGTLASLVLITSGGASPAQSAEEPGFLYFAGVFVKLVGVLLLIIGCGVLAVRWSQSSRRFHRGGQMMVVESIRLAPKQSLYLVRVGEQQFLIGATEQQIALISEVALPAEENDEQPIAVGQDFTHLLEGLLQGKSNGKG